jgi:AraC-like DNA-binding protein
MNDRTRLYERAAAPASIRPVWHVDRGRMLFIGPLRYNASHQHGAPVYLAGIYEPFHLRVAGGEWLNCRTAMIPAGVSHELDVGGAPIGVFYVEPSLAGADTLVPFLSDVHEAHGALIGASGETRLLRELWEDRASLTCVGEALDGFVAFSRPRARRPIDARVAAVVGALHGDDFDAGAVAAHAARVGLSPSRFQHLFSREVGVAFRRYRAWTRMRTAIADIARGSNFTAAAHLAGFSDQAHFGHDFRRTFGAPPSGSLRNIRR